MKARARGQRSGGAKQFDVGVTLRAVARPRLFGSPGAAEVTRTIRSRLKALGYQVHEQSFRFNPIPGRFGVAAIGLLYGITLFLAATLLQARHSYIGIALLLLLLLLVIAAAAFAPNIIDGMRWGQREGVNLLAFVPRQRLRFIVMAHRDSKSQPLPLAFRGPAIAIAVIVWVVLFVVGIAHAARPLPDTLILGLGAVGIVAGALLIFCWADNRSPGALDNASGVVAALGIAAREREAGDVAILITDAEELGLAGARAAARQLPPVIGVINLDGLDDEGSFYVLERFGAIRKHGIAPHLAAALLEEAAARGEAADRRDLPWGIPVDHIPIARAGKPSLTLMRGTFASLRRVHLPGDDLAHLRGDGIERAIGLVSGALRRLREQALKLER